MHRAVILRQPASRGGGAARSRSALVHVRGIVLHRSWVSAGVDRGWELAGTAAVIMPAGVWHHTRGLVTTVRPPAPRGSTAPSAPDGEHAGDRDVAGARAVRGGSLRAGFGGARARQIDPAPGRNSLAAADVRAPAGVFCVSNYAPECATTTVPLGVSRMATRWISCEGCRGEVGVQETDDQPTVQCPKCGAMVSLVGEVTVQWRPAGGQLTEWHKPAGIISIVVAVLSFLASAIVGGGDFAGGIISGLLNPIFWVGALLSVYWLGRAHASVKAPPKIEAVRANSEESTMPTRLDAQEPGSISADAVFVVVIVVVCGGMLGLATLLLTR
jgi:predicted nucleic acid-binding Zn ribbon protein